MDDFISYPHWDDALRIRCGLALDPQLRLRRHQMVEYITTHENPRRLETMDEETHDDYLTQFGSSSMMLPSTVPQRMKKKIDGFQTLCYIDSHSTLT